MLNEKAFSINADSCQYTIGKKPMPTALDFAKNTEHFIELDHFFTIDNSS